MDVLVKAQKSARKFCTHNGVSVGGKKKLTTCSMRCVWPEKVTIAMCMPKENQKYFCEHGQKLSETATSTIVNQLRNQLNKLWSGSCGKLFGASSPSTTGMLRDKRLLESFEAY